MQDQSQKAAEPLQRVEPAEFIRRLSVELATQPSEDSETAKANRARAGNEISMIFELNSSRAFAWFESEFIDKPFREASEKLRNEFTTPSDLPLVKMTYDALKKVKVGVLERHLAHLMQLNPSDAEIPKLRERLSLL
jgi:hypothetical protein